MLRTLAGPPHLIGQDLNRPKVVSESRDSRPGPPRLKPGRPASNCAATPPSAPTVANLRAGVDSSDRRLDSMRDQGKVIDCGGHLGTGRATQALVRPIRASFQTGLGRCSIETGPEGGTSRRSGVSARLAGPWKRRLRRQRNLRSPAWPQTQSRRRRLWSVSNRSAMRRRVPASAHIDGRYAIERGLPRWRESARRGRGCRSVTRALTTWSRPDSSRRP